MPPLCGGTRSPARPPYETDTGRERSQRQCSSLLAMGVYVLSPFEGNPTVRSRTRVRGHHHAGHPAGLRDSTRCAPRCRLRPWLGCVARDQIGDSDVGGLTIPLKAGSAKPRSTTSPHPAPTQLPSRPLVSPPLVVVLAVADVVDVPLVVPALRRRPVSAPRPVPRLGVRWLVVVALVGARERMVVASSGHWVHRRTWWWRYMHRTRNRTLGPMRPANQRPQPTILR